MLLNSVEIKNTQTIVNKEGELVIIGIGSDNYMYQYGQSDDCWNRLSTRNPYKIVMFEPEIAAEVVVEPVVEAPVEAPEAAV